MTVGNPRTIWLPCLAVCLVLLCQTVTRHRRPDWQRPCRVEGGGEFGWEMDALSIMEALGGGLRSWHVEVRERWSVRSQQSLTTPDLSSRQEQHRICLWWQLPEYLLPLWAKSNVLTRKKGIEKGPVRMMSFRGFGESTRPMQDPVLPDRKKKPA